MGDDDDDEGGRGGEGEGLTTRPREEILAASKPLVTA